MSAEGGEPEPLTRGPGRSHRWSPDGEHIYFTGAEERAGNLWVLSLEDGRERPITNLVGRRGDLGTPVATDGKHVYFVWREDLGDVWVMDVVRE